MFHWLKRRLKTGLYLSYYVAGIRVYEVKPVEAVRDLVKKVTGNEEDK